MNIFSKRPLLLALSVFILFSVISAHIGSYLRILFSILAMALLIASLTVYFCLIKQTCRRAAFTCLLCAFFCFLAIARSCYFFDYKLANAENLNGEVNIVARIDECTYKASYTSVYTAKLYEVNGNSADFSIELASVGPSEFEKGDIISTIAVFSPFSIDEYGFNERSNNISKNILAHAEFENAEKIEKADTKYFFSDLREKIAKRIDRGGLGDSAGIIKALLLGDKSGLEAGTSLNYRRMGISHILSISGTHFTVLLGTAAIFMSAIGFDKKKVYFLLIPFAVFYMGLTGFSESVCRSGIMAIIAYSGFLLGRNNDSYTALAISVSTILAISPHTVLSISLWLSFIATFTILLLNDLFAEIQVFFAKLRGIGKIIFAILMNIMISVLISITTVPIVAAVFGEISVISPITNLLIVPLFTLLLYIIPFCAILPSFPPLSYACNFLCDVINSIGDYVCSIDGLLISLKHFFVVPLSLVSCIAMLLLIALPLRRKMFVLIPPAACIIILSVCISIFNCFHFKETHITYFTEGESDGIVVADQNETLCIDISTGYSSPAYCAEYISEENYCPEIGAYMFTHYHSRHVSMFAKLCSRTHVRAVYLPIATNDDSVFYMKSIADVAEDEGVDIVWFEYNKPTSFCASRITVYEPIFISRSTHPVINLQITTKNNDILYLGSSFAETNFEYTALSKEAEYLIFGQHNPVVKKPFSVESEAVLIFGSNKHAELFDGKHNGVILEDSSQYEILLK